MASTKHHDRFHAAVLRYLFPPSPPRGSSHQETADRSCEDICSQDALPKYAEPIAEEISSDHADDSMEVGKVLLSRAQRKRLKLKRLKEEQTVAMPAERFIGPSLPDELEKKKHEVVDRQSSCALLLQDHGTSEKFLTRLNSEDRDYMHDVRDAGLPTATKSMPNKARELETEEERHGEAESEPLSKAKRRRIAKKKFQNTLQRYPRTGSSFTAELKGGDIVIKQMV